MNLSLERKAKYACLYAGAVWGLFWIPLRELEDAGFQGLWITVVYFLIPALCLVPVTIWRWKYVKRGGFQLQLTAIISGGALLLYSTSIVYTDVVRAILLFYLTPVWGIILGRIFLGEKISTPRVIAMILAVIGMLTIFGLGSKFPLPQNLGDWLGLCSGFMWAIAMVLINKNKNHSTIELTVGFFQWSLILSLFAAVLLSPNNLPSFDNIVPVIPLMLTFMVLLILPGTYASLWGPKYLNPGVVGLLFMTEVVIGAISVSILAGEPFGIREITGVLFIAGASILEPLSQLRNVSIDHR
ncbi:DMT family transporter [Paracoccaceae bacterium]|nr:DMT family transporter [Paracoccaceae bacterium]